MGAASASSSACAFFIAFIAFIAFMAFKPSWPSSWVQHPLRRRPVLSSLPSSLSSPSWLSSLHGLLHGCSIRFVVGLCFLHCLHRFHRLHGFHGCLLHCLHRFHSLHRFHWRHDKGALQC